MLPPQKNQTNDEFFAKKVVEILGKEPKISDSVAVRLALARQNALTKMKISKENEIVSISLIDEDFAKKITNVLTENMLINSDISHRLVISRQKALNCLRESKKDTNIFTLLINKVKEKLSVQIMAGITATATVSFALIGVAAMDLENEIIYDQNVTAISIHFDSADSINQDVEKVLIADDEEDNII